MVSTPETIEDGDLHGKLSTIKFKKDGITIVGVVASGSIDLYTQTMYISKKNRSLATATDEQASVNTSETTSGTAFTDSIAHSEGFSQYSDRASAIDWLMGSIDEYL